MIRGVIFDLDGTLLDTGLDFPAIRRDLGLPPDTPILEALAATPPGPELDRLWSIVREHELAGARRAQVYDGVPEFLEWLQGQGIPQAILTRNSRESAELSLARLNWSFAHILTREDAPPKPDPAGLLDICRRWTLPAGEVMFFGDYLYDLQAGRRAGMTTVLYAPGPMPPFAAEADHLLRCYADGPALMERCRSAVSRLAP